MMNGTEIDFLIVGQGIAGTCLAWQLIEKGQRVLIVNDTALPSATQVAAGIFNPITGRKLVKTWMAEELFPFAQEYYTQLEKVVQARLMYHCSIYRPYRSPEEKENYQTLTSDPGVAKYITQVGRTLPDISGLHHPYGGLEVSGAGWVDLNTLIQKSREKFIANGHYLESEFDSRDLSIYEDSVEWKGIICKKIILCTGYSAFADSLFGWLPFNPVKGQILDVSFEEFSASKIVNQGIFILPRIDHAIYRVGATYSWHDLDWNTTLDGRDYLEKKLRLLVNGGYTIHSQKAGIRPSSKDRRPFVGLHPRYSCIGIFNGLGTKGVTLAPFFARQFIEHLLYGKELNPEVNIARYFSLYYH